jgi:hypothetical protein
LAGRLEDSVPSHNLAFSIDQDWLHEAESLDRSCELLDVIAGVSAQGTFVGLEGVNRQVLDRELQITVEGFYLPVCRRGGDGLSIRAAHGEVPLRQ